ncbi:phosphatidylinositol kinase- protein kinase tor1 [Sorochytrium milnesiophthora]
MSMNAFGADRLSELLVGLKSRSESTRVASAEALKQYVITSSREKVGDAFGKFLADVNKLVFELILGADNNEKMGGILAIGMSSLVCVRSVERLIEVDGEENTTKLTRYGNYLHMVLVGGEPQVMILAARVLGKLVSPGVGGAFTAEFVEGEVKQALDWLQLNERQESRKYGAVLILKEVMQNAPTLVYAYVPQIVDQLWLPLRDTKIIIREAAADALSVCVELIYQRETTMRAQWFGRIYDEAQKGFRIGTVDYIHGSLLVLRELLVHCGRFMDAKFKEICETLLKYKDHKEGVIRRTVVAIIPNTASYHPAGFEVYLSRFLNHLIGQLRKERDSSAAFVSVGKVALAVESSMKDFLEDIIKIIKETLMQRGKGRSALEAPVLQCVSMLAIAVGPALTKYVHELLELMFHGSLSEPLRQALVDLAKHIPPLLPAIQERLLNLISIILSGQPYRQPGSPARIHAASAAAAVAAASVSATAAIAVGTTGGAVGGGGGGGLVGAGGGGGSGGIGTSPMASYAMRELPSPESRDTASVLLALRTLGTFDFKGHSLNEFIREVVTLYLDDDMLEVRQAAVTTCASILAQDPVQFQTSGHSIQTVNEVLGKLIMAGIADPDAKIRQTVLESLTEQFDHYLAQADNVRSIFFAMNDEVFSNRELAMSIVGRLAIYNPAYVLPSLRKKLIQLLTELEYSNMSRTKEECARLLGKLVAASRHIVKPYVEPMLRVVIDKARDPSPGVASAVLSAIGELAQVSGDCMQPHLDALLPLIIETLQDQSAPSKRLAALKSLGQIASSTGYVIEPYIRYPHLLDTIIAILKTEQNPQLRTETLKLLGILGALDPYKHKIVQRDSEDGMVGEAPRLDLQDATTILMSGTGGLSSDEYYPAVCINALMRILRDPSLSMHHTAVIKAVLYICKTLGLKSVPFLPQIMPPFLAMIKTCPPSILEQYLQELAGLVVVVGPHVRKYLPDIFDLICEQCSVQQFPLQVNVVALAEALAVALDSEFKAYLPTLLPFLLQIVEHDVSEKRRATSRVLDALNVFGAGLEEYLHLVVPCIMRLVEGPSLSLTLRQYAVQTIGNISMRVSVREHASQIVHPLTRCLSLPQRSMVEAVMDTLSAIVLQLGTDYAIFIPMVYKAMSRNQIHHPRYESLLHKILNDEPLPGMGLQLGDSGVSGVSAAGGTSLQQSQQGQSQSGDGAGAGESGGVLPSASQQAAAEAAGKKLPVHQQNLKRAWETNQKATKDDWLEWLRRLSIELIKESPSAALRACHTLASVYYPLARELFNVAFVSCWAELYDQFQDELVRALETALVTPNIPPEVIQALLNLAEFMEHDDKALPIDIRTLGDYATRCQAYAKALHYKELEFISEPSTSAIENLISINTSLQQPDAAVGILKYAQQSHEVGLKENWYIKLERWEEGLDAYERRRRDEPHNFDVLFNIMKCLYKLGEWEALSQISKEKWQSASDDERRIVAQLAVAAEWGLGHWDAMDEYISVMKTDTPDGAFFRAILAVHRNLFAKAELHISRTRDLLDTEFTALVGESYSRAYTVAVRMQMLAELEEIIQYKRNYDQPDKQLAIRRTWNNRLRGVQRNVEAWNRILKVRSVVLSPQEDMQMWIKFASLCRKNGRQGLSTKTLTNLLGFDPAQSDTQTLLQGPPLVVYAYLKHLWEVGRNDRGRALALLGQFTQRMAETLGGVAGREGAGYGGGHNSNGTNSLADRGLASGNEATHHARLLARCYFRLGEWQTSLQDRWSEDANGEILHAYRLATHFDKGWYKAWHHWALANFEVVAQYERSSSGSTLPTALVSDRIVPSVQGFFRSIALTGGNSLQDTLRLLTLWFKYGYLQSVHDSIADGFNNVPIDTWLQVIPQLIARIHAPSANVRRLIHQLLTDVGKEHPQALIYSLMVASKSQSSTRTTSALAILDKMRTHRAQLVEQGLLVSQDLIRVAILWEDMWREGLEEASRQFYGEHNIEGMLAVLEPLHAMMAKGPETLREVSFHQMYGRDLQEAHEWCQKYRLTGDREDLNPAWELYFQVFKRINKQLLQLTTLELQYVSPKLQRARNLELAAPGTYKPGEPVVRIASFAPTLTVISSKQRPRRLVICGDDGRDYQYLLKGHEDLRQDERVMQLFGLVNHLLSTDSDTFERHLNIQRYAVIPLSPNSGLIGWVSNCDTLHQLIRDYRDSRKILLNIEHRLMLQMAPDYDTHLTAMQKIEVFEYALENTTGQDLYKVLWLKSKSSEAWLERRTNYTRSLAVMSMVGYVLGLGDRHPSNLMLDRLTGKIVHIDFGDCFEVAMHRDKFPERIPFRLTRMLIKAMEVSGIEGSFRITCEHVMRVLRENKDSLMAVLEAFVYDPLINWRLMTNASPRVDKHKKSDYEDATDKETMLEYASLRRTRADESALVDPASENDAQEEGGASRTENGAESTAFKPDTVSDRAVQVISRVQNKLTGRDFNVNNVLDVHDQVERLILQATSLENLCLCFIGWCAFW